MIIQRFLWRCPEKQGQAASSHPSNPFEKPSCARIDEPYPEHCALGPNGRYGIE
jgi:hypothetical protein